MSRALTNTDEMLTIYEKSKDVFDGKYSVQYALLSLQGHVTSTESSLKMYFKIYSCMRRAKCYKMGTSEAFTRFLLIHIYKDYGREALCMAISSVKGNSAYRDSVNNSQPGLERACHDAIIACDSSIIYEEIPAAITGGYSERAKKEKKQARNGKTTEADNGVHSQGIAGPSLPIDYTIKGEGDDVYELNIQPAAGILNVFSRLSYKPWYAIAEFVDNSTQSYFSHASILNELSDFDKLRVVVKYNARDNSLSVTDNAYGMEMDRFRDAILLDSRNGKQSGRNEFGMGLKTAASWFGNIWRVTSTQYGSANRYSATVDIPKLKELNLNSVQIHRDYVSPNEHGTEIVIEEVTKKITAARTIGKIRDLLSSMYRRDINNKNIEIWFNDEPIVFEDYPILTNFRGKSWKKDLDFSVSFGDKIYRVTGFVAIMNPGSFPKSGFALFRQDRVVVGGTDNNYKPPQIFGQAQSQRSLKLFGELNMNDFPVNQAKDGFIWDDGLEDAFVDALKSNIQEYIDIADMSIKERANEIQYSEPVSQKLQQDVDETLRKAFSSDDSVGDKNDKEKTASEDDKLQGDIREYVDTVLHEEIPEKRVGGVRSYKVNISPINSVKFNVQWSVGNSSFWIQYSETSTDVYEVLINIDHPFFMPFSREESFKRVLEKFALSFILSERQAKLVSDKQGYIPVSAIKNFMNQFLKQLAED